MCRLMLAILITFSFNVVAVDSLEDADLDSVSAQYFGGTPEEILKNIGRSNPVADVPKAQADLTPDIPNVPFRSSQDMLHDQVVNDLIQNDFKLPNGYDFSPYRADILRP